MLFNCFTNYFVCNFALVETCVKVTSLGPCAQVFKRGDCGQPHGLCKALSIIFRNRCLSLLFIRIILEYRFLDAFIKLTLFNDIV